MEESRLIVHQLGKDVFYKTWHSSREHIFIYFHSDGGSIVSADRVFPIRRGALVFISADTYHYTMPEEPEVYDRSKLILSREKLQGILQLLGEEHPAQRSFRRSLLYAECSPSLREGIEKALEEYRSCATRDQRELFCLSLGMKLMLPLTEGSREAAPAAVGMMAKALDYIHGNVTSFLDVESICKAVNMSKYHFCRQFKAHTGMTVMNYVLKTRLMLAKTELKHPLCSVSEISEHFGFSSVSYFCRVFKESEGCTPLQYRKQMEKE